jgi:hypothetical protein
MGAFRRVEGEQAGPAALGILIPPGRRTFVILRPRALPWDLLLLRDPGGTAFSELAHDEASAAAQALFRALRDGSAGGRAPTLEVLPEGQGDFRLLASVGPFALLACPRVPGQPYRPLRCRESEARAAAAALAGVLHPAEGAEQELYFNTRFFQVGH